MGCSLLARDISYRRGQCCGPSAWGLAPIAGSDESQEQASSSARRLPPSWTEDRWKAMVPSPGVVMLLLLVVMAFFSSMRKAGERSIVDIALIEANSSCLNTVVGRGCSTQQFTPMISETVLVPFPRTHFLQIDGSIFPPEAEPTNRTLPYAPVIISPHSSCLLCSARVMNAQSPLLCCL